MKKVLAILMMCVMAFSLAACSSQTEETTQPVSEVTESVTEEPTTEPTPDWEYDQATKTLYVYSDMGGFEPDAPDFDGTTSNAPWAEYLPEIENIIVENDVTFIGDYAFAFCPNLKTVEVGENVGALDFRCFFKCGDFDSDSSIEMSFNSTPSFGDDVFGYTWDNPNVMIYVPDDMKEYWADYIMQKGEMKLHGYDFNIRNGHEDGGGDFGPQWSINIAGNFDIISDMVWQSVEVQDIKVGTGDTFKGYGLKALMDFSGNGAETARVIFGDNGGSDVEVNPTYDAYIVYMMNGEFLGGPYLLSIDGLSEFPVIEVHTN